MITALQDKKFQEHDALDTEHDYEVVRKYYKGNQNKYYKLKCRLCNKELVTLSHETVRELHKNSVMPVEDPPTVQEDKPLTAKGHSLKYSKAQKGWY